MSLNNYMVILHLYYCKMEDIQMTEDDIISPNIVDLEGLVIIEEFINQITISKLFTKRHKQLIVESIFSVQELLIEMGIFDSRENFIKYLQRKLKRIECKDKSMTTQNSVNGKAERKKIFIKSRTLKYKDSIFAMLFTHELVHIISSGTHSIGLVSWKIGARTYIGKFIQEGICGGLSQDKDINEAETEYFAYKFLETNFLNYAELKKYELELYPNHKAIICYKGCSYYELAVYMDAINYIFAGELEKAYLTDGYSLKNILKRKEFLYLIDGVDTVKGAYKKYYSSATRHTEGKNTYEAFMNLFEAYSKLIKTYLQKESLTKGLKQKILGNPIYVDGVGKSLNEQLLEELVRK